MSDVTRILEAARSGDASAAEKLLEAVYQELHSMAKAHVAEERPGQTLQPTDLVHEVYMRLFGSDATEGLAARWKNRRYFFAAAAEAMRRILVERARAKQRVKRGGGIERTSWTEAECHRFPIDEPDPDHLLALNEALDRFTRHDPFKAEFVRLRFFAGLTIEQTAEVLEISTSTAERYWTYSRAWLFDQVNRDGRS